jgi:hypothetical protein
VIVKSLVRPPPASHECEKAGGIGRAQGWGSFSTHVAPVLPAAKAVMIVSPLAVWAKMNVRAHVSPEERLQRLVK